MAELSASVVICCYTALRWERLSAAVASVRRQTVSPAEILVVVDHCPALHQRAREELPGARVLANEGPAGLSGARNTGVAASRGEVVAFLDDDAVAARDWLQRLLAEYADPTVLGAGGDVEADWADGRPAWFPREFDWVVGCSHLGLPDTAAVVRNFVGANMSFRRSSLTALGGFRADLGRVGTRPVGCEETELCIRLSARHPEGVLRYQPAAAVRHHVPAERRTWSYFRSRCYAEGLSKARVAGIAGTRPALAAERQYVRRVLPRGMAQAATVGIVRRDVGGLLRASALAAGLATTCVGYAVGRLRPGGHSVAANRVLVARIGPLCLAVLLWAASLRAVQLPGMTDVGLVSVLPVTYWVALALIVVSTAVLVHAHASERLLSAYLAGLILVLHATPTILYGGSVRYSWAWKHVGIVDYITRHGAVDPNIGVLSAYHAWPGFFALNALIVKAAGLSSALSYAAWAPPVFALLALGPLRLLFGTLAADRRQVWLALTIYYLANWVGQEYFSPQAFGFLLYLVVLALCLGQLPARRQEPLPLLRRPFGGSLPARPACTPASRRTLLAVVVLLMLAVVSSHQLTPFMLLSALTALVIGRHTGPAWLPAVLAVLTVAWIWLMAMAFLRQNLYWIVDSIGHPAANTQTTFVDLNHASRGQQAVDYADRALTGGMVLLGAAGWLRAGRTGSPRRVTALLALSPLPLLVVNNYSGEMLFRVFLFASPFLALLAAGLVYPRPAGRKWTVVLPVLLVVALTGPFCLAYYGKERMNYFTPDEVVASRWLYGHAPAGSLVVGGTANFPWGFRHYEAYRYRFLEDLAPDQKKALPRTPVAVLDRAIGRQRPAFVVLTRSQDVSARYSGVLPAGALGALAAALPDAADFHRVYRNADATIYELEGP